MNLKKGYSAFLQKQDKKIALPLQEAKGFTLLELIIVVAIVSIVAASSPTLYGRFFHQSSLQQTTDGLVNQMRKAQTYAMEGRQGGSWGIHTDAAQFILFQGNSYTGRNTSLDETFPIYPTVTVTGFTDVIFNKPTGTPSAAFSISITSGGTTKTVTVNGMGVISR